MKVRSSVVLLLLLTLILAACGNAATPTNETPSGDTPAGATPIVDNESTTGEGGDTPVEAGGDTGEVTILGAFTGAEETAFNQTIADFEAANPGINVTYVGTNDFDTAIEVRVQANDAPDIAAFPQPGGAARLARAGQLVPLWDEALAAYDANYAPVWQDLGSVDGTPYGMFHRVNAKGWIWYNKPAFEAAGYSVPTTWDELMTLTEEMKASGTAPWCEGIAAGDATGWKGTDWIENIMLRTVPVETYDQWVTGEVKFSSPEVKAAFELLGNIWTDNEAVYGGQQSIAFTDVPLAATYLFGDTPYCWLHMQGSFVTGFLQEDVQANLDEQLGVFIMPSINPDVPPALEIGGDIFVVTNGNDRPEVRKFVEFLGTLESTTSWAQTGGALFPHRGQDFSVYPTEIERNMAQTIVEAEAARFDGSDNMASETNRAFWKGITDWVSGGRTLDEALADIDAAAQ